MECAEIDLSVEESSIRNGHKTLALSDYDAEIRMEDGSLFSLEEGMRFSTISLDGRPLTKDDFVVVRGAVKNGKKESVYQAWYARVSDFCIMDGRPMMHLHYYLTVEDVSLGISAI